MKKSSVRQIIFLMTTLVLHFSVHAQEIVNIVYVGDKGVTEDFKTAHSFILVKQYPGGNYERLDYKIGAPLIMLRTYKDSSMSNLDGKFLKYNASGALEVNGQYSNNQKNGDWLYYNDTGKVVMKETYDNAILMRTENPDTVKTKDAIRYGDEREAEFASSKNGWVRYLQNALSKIPSGLLSLKGKIHVMFTVNTEGKTTDVYLKKSAQFGLDEEALKIVRLSPLWKPAFQNGHSLNAYRIQPFTFRDEN